MSSQQPLPTTLEMLDAFAAEVRGRRKVADARRGSLHELVAGGPGAILWAREARRDRDLFRACFFDSARAGDLDYRITSFGGPERIQATRGRGTAVLRRASAAGGAGIIWAGTRVAVYGRPGLRHYRVATDKQVTTETAVTVAIEAQETGAGFAISAYGGDLNAKLEDLLWDNSWSVERIDCADGTEQETDAAYLGRYRQGKLDRRAGYAKSITDACKAVGAAYVSLFESDFGGVDMGLNRCFVADETLGSPPELIRACRLAVHGVRVLGCDLTVHGMQRVVSDFVVHLTMTQAAMGYDAAGIKLETAEVVRRYLADPLGKHFFSRDALRGAIAGTIRNVQAVDLETAPADADVIAYLAGAYLPVNEAGAVRVTVTIPRQ